MIETKEIFEYAEEYPVVIDKLKPEDGEQYKSVISERSYKGYLESRWVVAAKNEGGCNGTAVDLVELLAFVKKNLPEIWNQI